MGDTPLISAVKKVIAGRDDLDAEERKAAMAVEAAGVKLKRIPNNSTFQQKRRSITDAERELLRTIAVEMAVAGVTMRQACTRLGISYDEALKIRSEFPDVYNAMLEAAVDEATQEVARRIAARRNLLLSSMVEESVGDEIVSAMREVLHSGNDTARVGAARFLAELSGLLEKRERGRPSNKRLQRRPVDPRVVDAISKAVDAVSITAAAAAVIASTRSSSHGQVIEVEPDGSD